MSFPMKTKIVGLVKNSNEYGYIYGKNKNYVVPEYQREYSWGEEQIESFVTSIKHALDGESVFMGTVQFDCESENELHIIDGQQRMTTFLLLCNILEKQTGVEILSKNNMSLSIKNFESNNNKLEEALNVKYEEIDNIVISNNRYIENIKILKHSIEELECEPDKIKTAIFEKMYFVELVTEKIPLPQVVGIFNTINTTGLDLNCSDMFKLQYFEYLKKNVPDKKNIWMSEICHIYEEVNKENINMNDILTVYKHCIVARCGWKLDVLTKSNEMFFNDIFFEKDINLLTEDDKKAKDKALCFEEFTKIVYLYIDLTQNRYKEKSINAFAVDVIWETRYRMFWTLPYVIAYFNGGDYGKALGTAMTVAKAFVVNSVTYDKAINPVKRRTTEEILPAIVNGHDIKKIVYELSVEYPYGKSDNPYQNKEWFIERIRKNLFYNGKRAFIVCSLSALIEEIDDIKEKLIIDSVEGISKGAYDKEIFEIKKKLFDWKNFQYDMEHIYARNKLSDEDSPYLDEYNGIGNLVVLNRSINRSIGDKDVSEKVKEYKESSRYKKEPKFVAVENVAQQIEAAGNSWGIEQVIERQRKQEKMLCDFLGLNRRDNHDN